MYRLILVAVLLLLAGALPAAAPAGDRLRGGTIEWARLHSEANPDWNRHADSDAVLINVLRRTTSLNVDLRWRAASASKLDELARYPFLYAANIAQLSAAEARNLGEYLRRGGFMLIDACINHSVNPDLTVFLRGQLAILSGQFPNLKVTVIEPRHEVFSSYFRLRKYPPFPRPENSPPLHAVSVDGRTIAIISLNGFQCGWAGFGAGDQDVVDCVQMVTNIYIYAMTR